MKDKSFYENLGSAFVAHFSRRLADLVIEQSTEIIRGDGLSTPTTSVSTVLLLSSKKSLTVTDMASQMGVSHQMMVQRISTLEKLGLTERFPSPTDGRSRLIRLSKKGKVEAAALEQHIHNSTLAFDDLENEIDCNLSTQIRRAEIALQNYSLQDRIDKIKQRSANSD